MPTANIILKEQFMKPSGLSAYMVAKMIHVNPSRVLEILYGKRRITADTSLRLGKLFGVDDDYFLILQGKDDIKELKEKLKDDIETIKRI